MRFWDKLQNPFFLVGQGFLLGGLLFLASVHQAGEAHSAPSTGLLQIETGQAQG
jgi:hypothetical protein